MSDQIDYADARRKLTDAIEVFLATTGHPDLVPNAWVIAVNSKDVNYPVGRSHVTIEHMGDMATTLGLNMLLTEDMKSIIREDSEASN